VLGLLRHRMYTYRWLSLLVWLYFTEGVVRATSDQGWSQAGGGRGGAVPAAVHASALYIRWRLRHGQGRRPEAWQAAASLLRRCAAAVGAAHVLTERRPEAWELDWRRRWHGKALAVVRPGSTEEVAAVVRACAAAPVPPSCRRAATPAWWAVACPMPAAPRCC
jgi:hypothetical protein